MKTDVIQRIWIIDDDPSVRQALARLLECHGYSVETFSSGTEFYREQHAARVSCLLLDIYLPDENGVAVFDKARESGFSSPVLFVTAKATGDLVTMARERAPILRKPFDTTTLLTAVAQAASQCRSPSASLS